jgi:hypothetical protein
MIAGASLLEAATSNIEDGWDTIVLLKWKRHKREREIG